MKKLAALLLLFYCLPCAAAAQNNPQAPESLTTLKLNVPLLTPPLPTASGGAQVVGNPGPQTYYYWVVSRFTVGASSPAGPFLASNVPNILTGGNYVSVFWQRVPGANTYDLLRTTAPAAPSGACGCAVATGLAVPTGNDQSNTLNPYTVSPIDPATLGLSLTNEAVAAAASHLYLRQNGSFVADLSIAGTAGQVGKFVVNYPGADWGAKVAACLADTSSIICDGRAPALQGAQAISAPINVTSKALLIMDCSQVTSTVTPAFSIAANFQVLGLDRTCSKLTSSSGGVIFAGSGIVKEFVAQNVGLNGSGINSQAITTPAYTGINDWSQSAVIFQNVLVNGFGNFALDFGQSTYIIYISELQFTANVGSIRNAWASDFVVQNSVFFSPAVNAAYPNGNPQVQTKGGSSWSICNSGFERDDGPNPAGKMQQPDLYIDASAGVNAAGYGHVCNNKFGGEGDSATRVKVLVASSTGVTTDNANSVDFVANQFAGLGVAGQTAIRFANPINRFRFLGNHFGAFTTIFDDVAALAVSPGGESILAEDNTYQAVGGTNPTESITLFTNGGRFFAKVPDAAYNADPGLPVTIGPRQLETAELRNRLTFSEDLTNVAWTATGVTVLCGQADPFGTTRACQLTRAGIAQNERMSIAINNANRRNRLVVKLWAKAGSLTTLQPAITAGTVQGAIPLLSLGSDWKQYKVVYNGVSIGTAYTLQLYPKDFNEIAAGTVLVCCVQVSDFDSDYLQTTGVALADTAKGSHYDRFSDYAVGYDISTTAAPANPVAGKIRVYGDSGTGNLTCLTNAGANCLPGSAPGGANGAVQYNNAGALGGITNVTTDGANITALTATGPITSTLGTITSNICFFCGTVTLNNGAVVFKPAKLAYSVTAANAASELFSIYGGAAGTTPLFQVFPDGRAVFGGTGGSMALVQAAAPSGVAGSDILYADNIANRFKMINNNGTPAQVVASGVDINTSDQVTATHLAAALPVAQGGTGATSATGTGNVVLATSPTVSNLTVTGSCTGCGGGLSPLGSPVRLTAQVASIAATTFYTDVTGVDHMYLVCYEAKVTTAATTSSTLGPFQLKYTDATDATTPSLPVAGITNINQSTSNATTTVISQCLTVFVKASTALQYIMGYTTSGATPMAYALRVTAYGPVD